MAQNQSLNDLQQKVIDHYSPLPTTTITTPTINPITGQITQETMPLQTAIPAARRELQLDFVPSKSESVK